MVYASSSYRGQQAINITTFEAILLGDVNGDGEIDIYDLKIVKINVF